MIKDRHHSDLNNPVEHFKSGELGHFGTRVDS
jgi:hypothetical protein